MEYAPTTEIYLHSIGEAEREAMRVFEEADQTSHTNSHTEITKELAPEANPLISLVSRTGYKVELYACPREVTFSLSI